MSEERPTENIDSNSSTKTRFRADFLKRFAVNDPTDLVERDAEHVVQYEREALRRRQRVEHDLQRQPDPIGNEGLLLGITVPK